MANTGLAYARKTHTVLSNNYAVLTQVVVKAPSKGHVVLTGSGYVEILNPVGHSWIVITIGKSTQSNNNAQTGVQLPLSAPVTGSYRFPFSLTTVVKVPKGSTKLYMTGIKDPGPEVCYANGLWLTALFVA
jgi:hypothetical protein